MKGDKKPQVETGYRSKEYRMAREFNILALAKGNEHYVYVYDDNSQEPLLEEFQRQAEDSNLSLNWFDCAVLTRKAHEQAQEVFDLEKQTQRF